MCMTKTMHIALYRQETVITNMMQTETSSVNRTEVLTVLKMMKLITKWNSTQKTYIQPTTDGDCSGMNLEMVDINLENTDEHIHGTQEISLSQA